MEDQAQRRWLVLGLVAGLAAAGGAWLVRRGRAERRKWVDRTDEVTRRAIERLGVPARSQFVTVNGVELHVVVAGPEDGLPAVLLHGFPECWYAWQHQIPFLAEAGYRVVAPDQRGYNLSDKPIDVKDYRVGELTADVRELVRAFGRERAVIVGHDWGGAVAWRFAMDYPQMVERLVVMNAPHPNAFARELRENWAQRLKSWYALFFQIPWLPERLFSLSPSLTAQLFFRGTAVRKDAFSERDLAVLKTALSQPGALHHMIDWYRAALWPGLMENTRTIQTPTLLIWAEEDVALDRSLTYGLEEWVEDLRVHYVEDCGHWVQNEAPEEVNAQLAAFLEA